MKWQRSERFVLKQICQRHGIDVVEKAKEKRHHLDTEAYKKLKESERKMSLLNEQATELNEAIDVMLNRRNDLGDEIEDLLHELESTSIKLDKLKTIELTPEEASKVRSTYVGDMIEIDVRDFENLRRTAIDVGEDKEKRLRAEDEKKLIEKENLKMRQELEELRQSLCNTKENFRLLGKFFQAYIDCVKAQNPELADLATKNAVESVENYENPHSLFISDYDEEEESL